MKLKWMNNNNLVFISKSDANRLMINNKENTWDGGCRLNNEIK